MRTRCSGVQASSRSSGDLPSAVTRPARSSSIVYLNSFAATVTFLSCQRGRNRPGSGVMCRYATAAAAQRGRVLREVLRVRFEEFLDARDPNALAEPEAA